MRKTKHEAIHGFFDLSYSNYLVVPRSVLQSAPEEWQSRFVDMLNELAEMFPQVKGEYWVRRKEGNRFVFDEFADYQRGRRRIKRALRPEDGP